MWSPLRRSGENRAVQASKVLACGSCGRGFSHHRRRRAGRGPSTTCPPGGAPSAGCAPPESLWEGLTRVRWRAPCSAGGLGSLGWGLLCFGSRGDGPPGLTGIGCRDASAWRFLGSGPWCGVRLRGPKGSACKFRLETCTRPLSFRPPAPARGRLGCDELWLAAFGGCLAAAEAAAVPRCGFRFCGGFWQRRRQWRQRQQQGRSGSLYQCGRAWWVRWGRRLLRRRTRCRRPWTYPWCTAGPQVRC